MLAAQVPISGWQSCCQVRNGSRRLAAAGGKQCSMMSHGHVYAHAPLMSRGTAPEGTDLLRWGTMANEQRGPGAMPAFFTRSHCSQEQVRMTCY